MASQVCSHVGRLSPVIGNIVDEFVLQSYRPEQPVRHGPLRVVFAGSLTTLKCPLKLVEAIGELQRRGVFCELDILGDGPLRPRLLAAVGRLMRPNYVRLLGHIVDPISAIAGADALVLPSLTEGVSRAALEALFLGVPCMLRDVDGSAELIEPSFNGVLFQSDSQIPDALIAAAMLGRHTNPRRDCLLPARYRQNVASRRFLELMETD
jgi:glycosyltransferase involved in cell wall biosynthesis